MIGVLLMPMVNHRWRLHKVPGPTGLNVGPYLVNIGPLSLSPPKPFLCSQGALLRHFLCCFTDKQQHACQASGAGQHIVLSDAGLANQSQK